MVQPNQRLRCIPLAISKSWHSSSKSYVQHWVQSGCKWQRLSNTSCTHSLETFDLRRWDKVHTTKAVIQASPTLNKHKLSCASKREKTRGAQHGKFLTLSHISRPLLFMTQLNHHKSQGSTFQTPPLVTLIVLLTSLTLPNVTVLVKL